MQDHSIEILATTLFGIAILHTFAAGWFRALGDRFPSGSISENLFHLLGEIEVVFGIWAAVFFILYSFASSYGVAVEFVENLNFTEPLFVFVIMALAATRPILYSAERMIEIFAKCLPLSKNASFYWITLVVGTIFGSFITEPAAMTVAAFLLKDRFFKHKTSARFKYLTLGTLFVNVSIGGTLTHFAAPPVLMVASKWQWDTLYMLTHIGWKSVVAVVVSATVSTLWLKRELGNFEVPSKKQTRASPLWLVVVHLLFIVAAVFNAHHATVFIGIFLFFIGFTTVTREHQSTLKIKEALLVGFFLAGLVVLGALQGWWLQPLLQNMGSSELFFGAMGLTAITDNAALTYLGSLVPNLDENLKIALVSGAVAGGGLTVIANAPNPAAYSILQDHFGKNGISAWKLFLHALIPTAIAAACLLALPSL